MNEENIMAKVYNTMDYKIDKVEQHNDKRGNLIILIKNSDLPPNAKTFGEIYYITFSKIGTVRANHYHKKSRVWFVVTSGKLEIYLKDIKTGKKLKKTFGNEKSMFRIEIGPNIAHAFKSKTKNAVLLNYSNLEWEAEDIVKYEICPPSKNDKR